MSQLWNPFRNYDQGMDDAYMGREPDQPQSQQYMEGYEREKQLEETEIQRNKHGKSNSLPNR